MFLELKTLLKKIIGVCVAWVGIWDAENTVIPFDNKNSQPRCHLKNWVAMNPIGRRLYGYSWWFSRNWIFIFLPSFSLFLGIMSDKPKLKVILSIVILIFLIAHYYFLIFWFIYFVFKFQPLAFGHILFLYKIWFSLFFWLFFISFS